jgi:hypothetical protein
MNNESHLKRLNRDQLSFFSKKENEPIPLLRNDLIKGCKKGVGETDYICRGPAPSVDFILLLFFELFWLLTTLERCFDK